MVNQPVGRGALAQPGAPNGLDSAPQLRARFLGERHVGATVDGLLEGIHQRAKVRGGKVDVALHAARLLLLGDEVLERALGALQAEYHIPVHLHEPPIRVVREDGVARLPGQRVGHTVVHAKVEDGVHHPRHRDRGARANRQEQRLLRPAELPARQLLDALEVRVHLGAEVGRVLPRLDVLDAQFGADREAGRHRDSEVGHLRQSGALAAQDTLHLRRAVGPSAPEVMDVASHAGIPNEVRTRSAA